MKKLFFILISGIILLSSLHFVSAGVGNMTPINGSFTYKLMVPLPTSNGTVKEVTGIVDYIKTLYYFALGIAGLVAMAMIIVAGFQWLTSAGNYSKVGQAKTRMSNAVFGLLILLAAYLLLNTINPSLTRLKEPLLYFIDWTEPFDQTNVPGGGNTNTTPDRCDGVNSCGDYNINTAQGQKDCDADYCGKDSIGCWLVQTWGGDTACTTCNGINTNADYANIGGGTPVGIGGSDPCDVVP